VRYFSRFLVGENLVCGHCETSFHPLPATSRTIVVAE
jgi:hypothetical protein